MNNIEKALELYIPSIGTRIEIFGFNYDAKRMGGAPTITATVMHKTCLDGVLSEDAYVEFNGEKYFLKQTPTSSFSNADARYKHECEFVSERKKLDNVYFFDTVVGDPQGYDKPVSNSSVFSFFGNIREFAKRLNASLQYSKLQTVNADGTIDGYVVIVNNDVDDEEKLMSFSNVPFSTALQESYNQYEIPYYFVGKEIHFGYWQNTIEEPFRYGVDKELLSITKINANQKVINRCTGTGGTENIPYYYPNSHPQGEIIPLYNTVDSDVSVIDEALFIKNVLQTDNLKYTSYERTIIKGKRIEFYKISDFKKYKNSVTNKALIKDGTLNEENWFLAPRKNWTDTEKEKFSIAALGDYTLYDDNVQHLLFNKDGNAVAFRIIFDEEYFIQNSTTNAEIAEKTFKITISDIPDDRLFAENIEFVVRGGDDGYNVKQTGYSITRAEGTLVWSGTFSIHKNWFSDELNYDKAIYLVIKTKAELREGVTAKLKFNIEFNEPKTIYTWEKNSDKYVNLSELGLATNKTPTLNDEITFEQVSYVQPMPNLMPPIYWESNGEERFYNALNNTYDNPDTDEKYIFDNPYKDSKRVEHIVEFSDIKPTIEGMTNNEGQPINAFLAFAYDNNDNDAIDQNGNYVHPYFYAKLPKFDSFNLFTHANEKGEVTFSMKSGNCGACNFVLGVDSESGKNTVQVDTNGNLIKDASGNVKLGVPQERQNDTKNNEVWVALKKDTSTFGTIMPSAQHKYYPVAGDTFVLLNITMPIKYVKAAENRLKEEIIKYMHENNMEKFSFSIKFSRIYFAEHPGILDTLNENAFIKVEYNGLEHHLYVNSFAYKMTEGEALPEITVELAETLSASMNAIQAAVSQVKTDVLDRVQKMDIAAMVAANFLSKNSEDYAKQKITFNRGISVGTQDSEVANIDQTGHADIESAILKKYISSPNFRDGFTGEGFKMWIEKDGLSYLTVDVLTARQRMVIYEMLISKIRSVNGQLWVSAANGTIAKVVERDEDFEITFEDENTFMVGDYMRCQVFRGASLKSYWVEVSAIEGDRVYVAKSEFGDVLPQPSDNVVLCGSKNIGRQNAIHISATDDGQPRIDILNGISTKSFDGCLRTRLGNLDGIYDEYFGNNQPQGDGLYSDNAFLKGDFILRNSGQSVDTMFTITDGKITSAIKTALRNPEQKTLLSNYSFADGLNNWITQNESSPYYIGDNANLLLFDDCIISQQGDIYAKAEIEDSQTYIRLVNSFIKQSNIMFTKSVELDDAYYRLVDLTFDFKYRCIKSGYVIAFMDNVNFNAGDANAFLGISDSYFGVGSSDFSVELPNGDGYEFKDIDEPIDKDDVIIVVDKSPVRLINLSKKVEIGYESCVLAAGRLRIEKPIYFLGCEYYQPNSTFLSDSFISQWNGTGDFYLAFSGEILLHSLQLYSDVTEVKYATLFEQTDKLLALSAKNFNDDGSVKSASSIVVKPSGVGILTKDEKGNIASIGTYEDGVVQLTGEEIKLEGDITANGNVSIDKDGKITAKKASIEGKIETKEGAIGNFEIDEKGLKYEKGRYDVSINNDGIKIETQSSYAGLPSNGKKLFIHGEIVNDSEDKDFTVLSLERSLIVGEQYNGNGYKPILEINENSSFPSVALKTKGATICENGLYQQGNFLDITESRYTVINPLISSFWIVKSIVTSGGIKLPSLNDMRLYFNLEENKKFAYTIEIVSSINSTDSLYIALKSDSAGVEYEYKIIDSDGDIHNYVTLGKRKSKRFILVFDGESYYAHEI